jgi:hypothetical protein
MIRSIKALAAASLVLGACASSAPTDELAGETSADDAIDGKADGAVDGAYTYYEVWTDLRKCAAPVCGGFFLARLNRSYTTCADHTSQSACYVPSLDWSEAGLSDGLQAKLVAAANTDATSDGVHAIVRGRFAPQSYPQGNLGRFVVTEAWVEEGDAVSDGVFVRAKRNNIRCISAPCPTITEKALNTSRSANIADIDWSYAGLQEREIESFQDRLATDSGVIIAGDRYTVHEHGRTAKGRTATAAYSRLVDETPPCYVGGCSNEVCSDQEGVITTCQWEPQYACYANATCERRADGTCGWTETPELQACLAQY